MHILIFLLFSCASAHIINKSNPLDRRTPAPQDPSGVDSTSDVNSTSPLDVNALKISPGLLKRITCNRPKGDSPLLTQCQAATLEFPTSVGHHPFKNGDHTKEGEYALPQNYSWDTCQMHVTFKDGTPVNVTDDSNWVDMEFEASTASIYCARLRWLGWKHGLNWITGGTVVVGKNDKMAINFGWNPNMPHYSVTSPTSNGTLDASNLESEDTESRPKVETYK